MNERPEQVDCISHNWRTIHEVNAYICDDCWDEEHWQQIFDSPYEIVCIRCWQLR